MGEDAELPKFYQDKRIPSRPVLLAKYSRDGRFLAVVHTDYSLSIWDSQDILVNTFEQLFFQPKSNGRTSVHHSVFLEWSASNTHLYLIVDCNGFFIDVYGTKKSHRNFTYFDQALNSLMPHPTEDRTCVVTCLDKLILLKLDPDSHEVLISYRELLKTDATKKGAIPSFAQFAGVDGLILLWIPGHIYLIQPNKQILSSVAVKPSPPLRQRIVVDYAEHKCMVACRNELLTLSLPSLEVQSSYRDSVNDPSWKAIDYLPRDRLLLAVPEAYVLEGPVLYLLPLEGELEVAIYREPKEHLVCGAFHPSGRSILLWSEQGELVLFRKEQRAWHGPMYPYHFTYLKKNEQGPEEVKPAFREEYFPPSDRGIDKMECAERHPVDILADPPEVPLPYHLELVPGEEEQLLLRSDNMLPPPLDDIYNMNPYWVVCWTQSEKGWGGKHIKHA